MSEQEKRVEVERIWLYRYLAGPARWTVWPSTAGNPADAPQRADTEWIEVLPTAALSALIEKWESAARWHGPPDRVWARALRTCASDLRQLLDPTPSTDREITDG